ncbi:TetR/AcrR family transcriptional regulator [Pseudonocardia sp. TRM90224]|uniref:TetR/AcrR family transcriptional regulator n=1 Tax=Pseudonocardia sp. TRM90224 TaxID=2812678 RepID=UPI001E36F5CD|nr:TetR family transcriptional regulator [Pseudonocardia sp. TRM90224]
MSSPAAIRGQEVRQRLLAAAAALIPERGWTAVSTRVLAERAGVTSSVVHYHFRSLPELLNEAVISAMRGMLGELDPILDASGTPADTIDALLAGLDGYSGTDPMTLLFTEAYLAATRDDRLRAAMLDVIDEFRGQVADRLRAAGIAEPEATAAVVMATLDGLMLHRSLAPEQGPVAAVLRRLVSGPAR